MPLKIVHICHTFEAGGGGIKTFVDLVVNATMSSRTEHSILVIRSVSKEAVNETNEPIVALNFRWRRFPFYLLPAYRALKAYDVFFVHAAHLVVILPLLVFGRGRIFVFQHGLTVSHGPWLKRAIKKVWYSWVPALLGAQVICSTPTARQKMLELGIHIPDQRIAYVPFGVKLSKPTVEPSPLTGDRPIRIGMAGRLVASKRFDWVIESFRGLDPSHRFELQLAGDGPERARLAALGDAVSGERVSVTLLGHVFEMADFYSSIDLFVHPGPMESFGMVVVEALACGTPVVVFSDIGGTLSAIDHGATGFVLADRAALAGLWKQIDEAPEILDKMRRTVLQVDLSEYDIDRTRDELDDLALAVAR